MERRMTKINEVFSLSMKIPVRTPTSHKEIPWFVSRLQLLASMHAGNKGTGSSNLISVTNVRDLD